MLAIKNQNKQKEMLPWLILCTTKVESHSSELHLCPPLFWGKIPKTLNKS
jgi:hypothetical protein